jgi:LPS-assembly protein
VRTPWRDQADLPLFDSAALDFNPTSIYAPSAFSGIDRVSDAHQLTAGISTRMIRRDDGSEMARLGVAQRILFGDQRITPDGTPLTKRSSDLLVFGSTNALQRWHLDGVVQYNPEIDRVARSILNLRYSPGPFRTLSASYRFQRSTSEQLALGWQWPLWGQRHEPLWSAKPVADGLANEGKAASAGSAGSCQGTLYGVGRLEFSLLERRTTGAIAGLEYDAGCWIGRVVAQRKATGAGAQSTSLSVQLELIGLARLDLGTNPLTLLKDNIPGFRLLNDASAGTPARTATPVSTP